MKLLKGRISIVILAVAAAITLVAVFSLNYKDVVTVDQAGQSSVISAAEKTLQITPANQKVTEKPTAKVFFESITKTKPKSPAAVDEEVGHEYAVNLKAALAGDLAKAVKISRLQAKCNALNIRKQFLNNTYIRNSGGMSEGEIEQEIDNQRNKKHRKFEQDKKQCMDAFSSDYESELSQLTRHDALYQQALAGNAMAKYIYATQAHSEPYLTLLFMQGTDFVTVALEFTNDNLIERPDLGLLAYGQSYTSGGQFTPIRLSIGMAYIIAAGLCGANPDVINEIPMFQVFLMDGPNSFFASKESIMTLADTLSQQHCPL